MNKFQVGDLVRLKGKIPIKGFYDRIGIITKEIDENGFVVYFFSEKKYYGYDKSILEVVSE